MKRSVFIIAVISLRVNAFVVNHRTTRSSRDTLLCTSTTTTTTFALQATKNNNHDSNNSGDNIDILQDGQGHVNRDLAERIWNWEQDHRLSANLPKLDYSVRSGLRLVHSLVIQELPSASATATTTTQPYSDLVQEGLSALLDAMSHYPHNDSAGFEAYAKEHIQQQLQQSQRQSSSTTTTMEETLPKSVQSLLRKAKHVAETLYEQQQRSSSSSKNVPTLDDVAKEMKIDVKQLQDYIVWAKQQQHSSRKNRTTSRGRPLSMESTVEISHSLLEDSLPQYQTTDMWERQHGFVLDNGHVVNEEETINDNDVMNEALWEGDDDAWIKQHVEQVSGRLQDVIVDQDTNDDPQQMALETNMMEDVSDLLRSTLNDDEYQVIRWTFGMDLIPQKSTTMNGNKNPLTYQAAMAQQLQTTEQEISDMAVTAIRKLRHSYNRKDVESYLTTNDKDIENDSETMAP